VSRTARLWAVLAANLALVVGLVVVGSAAHSVGVWAEGADYLADAAAIGVSLLAMHLARRPGGSPRVTRYAAAVNAGWLVVVSLLLAAGAVDRLIHGVREVHGLPVLVVSGVAALVMLAGAVLLGGDIDDDEDDRGDERDEGEELNVRAVLLDTAADAAAAAGVAAAGTVIAVTGGRFWLDPAVALVIAVVVGWHALRLLRRIRTALRSPSAPLQGVPR
jgi:cobalt-zinc-cadmium efflux system protein